MAEIFDRQGEKWIRIRTKDQRGALEYRAYHIGDLKELLAEIMPMPIMPDRPAKDAVNDSILAAIGGLAMRVDKTQSGIDALTKSIAALKKAKDAKPKS